jgi:hypothetical protein
MKGRRDRRPGALTHPNQFLQMAPIIVDES